MSRHAVPDAGRESRLKLRQASPNTKLKMAKAKCGQISSALLAAITNSTLYYASPAVNSHIHIRDRSPKLGVKNRGGVRSEQEETNKERSEKLYLQNKTKRRERDQTIMGLTLPGILDPLRNPSAVPTCFQDQIQLAIARSSTAARPRLA
ncbi:unnamed protein product [Linum trigynum]|uniref:Uncharacterized protein n=1 Tax=Linum trigynum TaxID=586398 RepID=A0AAV2E942_9ROSI